AAARAAADYLNKDYTQAKLKAFAEPEYYKELTKTNEVFLSYIVTRAVVMAVGGVFGVMNTMFASIAARIKEVGVLRILGFKRWQILISFMLESLMIAAVGGALGCALRYFANFFEATSTLSGGQGGGKTVALKMVVDYQTVAAGMLFTLVMGRLGGLVPALSAMRTEILDSLRGAPPANPERQRRGCPLNTPSLALRARRRHAHPRGHPPPPLPPHHPRPQ